MELNASVVVFDDFAHDGQAEACAVGFGRVVRREEFGLLFVGQAGAVVDNGDARHGLFVLGLWTIFELDGDVRVELGIFGGLDTISDDIDEYAPHEFGVDIDLKILVILGGGPGDRCVLLQRTGRFVTRFVARSRRARRVFFRGWAFWQIR